MILPHGVEPLAGIAAARDDRARSASAPSHPLRRRSGPPVERPEERAGVVVADQKRDLPVDQLGVVKVVPRELFAHFLHNILEHLAFVGESSLKSSPAQPHALGDGVGGGLAGREALEKVFAHAHGGGSEMAFLVNEQASLALYNRIQLERMNASERKETQC